MKKFLLHLCMILGLIELPAQSDPLEIGVISSFSIPGDWVSKMLPSAGHRSLVPPLSELHGFQISPQAAKELSKAKLIVGLSPDLEPWLDSWAKANGREAAICWLGDESAHSHPSGDPHDHHQDPHLWTDPQAVLKALAKLHMRLQAEFGSKYSELHYQELVKEVSSVDEALQKAFAKVPPERRKLLTQHPNLGLFAQRYGLTIAGTILASSSAEAADPSARHYSQLLSKIRTERIRLIVVDAGQNAALARRLAEDAGIPAPLSLNFESLAPDGQEGSTWSSMMRRNGLLIRDALLRP